MKKFISIIIAIFILLQVNIIAFASDDFEVSANDVTISNELSELVPVEIKGNKGIMGFKITVEFNPDNIDVKSVSRGTVTAKGNFNTNFGTLGTKFDVVWNNTEEIKDDGTLFVLSITAKKSDKIKLSFSQPDTFNEKYQDVVLDCKDISVTYSTKEEITENTSEVSSEKSEQTTSQTVIDTSQILDAIDNALENQGYDSIEDVKDEEKFIEEVNKNLEIITGSKDYNVNDLDTLESMYNSAYEGEFVKEVVNNIETDKIHQAINDALDKVGVKDIASIPDVKKAEFVKAVEENLKEIDSDVPNISKDISTEDAIEIISNLNDIPDEDKTINDVQNDTPQESKNNITVYIVVGFVIAIIIVATVFIIKKKKK